MCIPYNRENPTQMLTLNKLNKATNETAFGLNIYKSQEQLQSFFLPDYEDLKHVIHRQYHIYI